MAKVVNCRSWQQGEKLYLSDELEAQARQRQEEYNDNSDDPIVAMLQKFLDTKLPVDWATRDIADRRRWLKNPDPLDAEGVELREKVCAAEFICEQMGRDMSDKEYKYLCRRISKLIEETPGWERVSTSRHAEKWYGVQRSFKRLPTVNDEDDL